VLLVGGGDWIAANHLRDHNVSVDQVDLDGEFMEQMKTDPLVAPHHEDAYEYNNMTSHQADIYTYLQSTNRQYDLILLDLPGAKNDGLLHLYSEEFYQMLNTHLTDNGQIVTWAYSEYTYGNHENILMNTLNEAGFSTMAEYHARNDYNNNGEARRGERFLILRKSTPNTSPINVKNGSRYVKSYKNEYTTVEWESTPTYSGVEANSIFNPNHELIINNRLRAKQGAN
jgi:spermidine synthase